MVEQKQEPVVAKALEAEKPKTSAPAVVPQPKTPSAEDFRRMESQRDQADARAKKAANELESLRGELDELKLTAELAQRYGGDENAIAAARTLADKERELQAQSRRLQRAEAELQARQLEVAAGLFHTQNQVPLSVFEGIKSIEGVEAAAYRWLYEQKAQPVTLASGTTKEEPKPDYETGTPTRRGKSVADMTPEEAEKARVEFLNSHLRTASRR